ncbi:Phosphatase NudJ [Halioglobus japonicus]|nr:Phosphatase NudJ [Halioglobus japonicus]
MGFCYRCGNPLEMRTPEGDDQQRECCTACDYVHYTNPRILVSCLIYSGTKILWIRRGLEPCRGLWAMPAGFMEQGESLQQAAARELHEETGLKIDPSGLQLSVLSSLTFIDEVYIVFRCFHEEVALPLCNDEILEVAWLEESEAPWEQLAYPDTEPFMRSFYREVCSGKFGIYLGEFSRLQQQLMKLYTDASM